MNRKDRRAHKFGHWSPNRQYYQPEYAYEDMRYQINCAYWDMSFHIDCAYWESVDKTPKYFPSYSLWKFTH